MKEYCYKSLETCKRVIDGASKNDNLCEIIQASVHTKTSLIREEMSIKYLLVSI